MHKQILSLILLCAGCTSTTGDIHVALHGSDTNPGDVARPVATLQGAQRLVRQRIQAGHGGSVNVLIHPGVYEIDQPLVLEPQDSGTEHAPITWRALDPQDKPILSAGSLITAQWQPSDKPGIWVVDVPAAKKQADGGGWNFRQLFVDGQRAIRARFPNKDEDNPFLYADDRNKGTNKDQIAIDPALIKDAWLDETDAQINLVVDWLFFNQWNTIASIDKQEGKIFFTDSEQHGRVWKNNWFYIEGLFAELDQPGEWYLDRKHGRLYYMPKPGEDPNDMRFVAPRLDRIIYARGDVNAGTHVEHVRFDGLIFRHTAFTLGHIAPRVHTDATVHFDNVQHSTVTNCLFENIGGYAFWLHLDSQHNTFDRNTVLDSGGGGVLLTGARLSYMDDSKVYTQGEAASKVAPILNQITRNTVKHCGKIRYYGGGVHLDSRPFNMAMLPGNRIANNHFEDLSRNGVFAFRNQGGNVVEYNHIHDAMQTTIDGACIHFATMNHLNAPNYILNNWLYDIWGFRYLPDQKPKRVLANGVFLDWDTSNTTVRDNYVYNSGGKPIKAIWDNWNISLDNNPTSPTRIVPQFVDQLGPEGTATHGIDLESNRLAGRVIHYSEQMYVKTTGTWQHEQIGGLGKLFTYNLLKASTDKPASITYTLPIPEDGVYQLSLLYKTDAANATNASIQVRHDGGVEDLSWDMTQGNKHGFAVEIGSYTFKRNGPASVTITNHNASGYVIADAVAFVKADSATQ